MAKLAISGKKRAITYSSGPRTWRPGNDVKQLFLTSEKVTKKGLKSEFWPTPPLIKQMTCLWGPVKSEKSGQNRCHREVGEIDVGACHLTNAHASRGARPSIHET